MRFFVVALEEGKPINTAQWFEVKDPKELEELKKKLKESGWEEPT